MGTKFPFSTWIYHNINEMSPDEIRVWAECGLTLPMSPRIQYARSELQMLLPFLDAAKEHGLQLIAFVEGILYDDCGRLGLDAYEQRVQEVYDTLRHPALYGFYIGDEPSNAESFRNSVDALRIQKKVAPELHPYLNFHDNMADVPPEQLEGKSFRGWLKSFAEKTGLDYFSYGHYGNVSDLEGYDTYYKNLRYNVSAAENAGVDIWNCQLSSGHLHFRIPTEYEIMWMITTAAACGSRGIIWFRFYDRLFAPNYHGSPIDEYHNLTANYYAMMRCQRRFNLHYGELLMSLRHRKTYMTKQPMGGYEEFDTHTHPVITAVNGQQPALVSFFEDPTGQEYLILVNASTTQSSYYEIEHDRSRYKLEELLFNGEDHSEYTYEHGKHFWDGYPLHPGQMGIFRITER